jgi:ACS family pantothenate transporter-like MFS transporter
MRNEYVERVERKGYGKPFHSLRGVEVEYVTELLGWVNEDAVKRGGTIVEGHSEAWKEARVELVERMKKMFEGDGVPREGVLVSVCS